MFNENHPPGSVRLKDPLKLCVVGLSTKEEPSVKVTLLTLHVTIGSFDVPLGKVINL